MTAHDKPPGMSATARTAALRAVRPRTEVVDAALVRALAATVPEPMQRRVAAAAVALLADGPHAEAKIRAAVAGRLAQARRPAARGGGTAALDGRTPPESGGSAGKAAGAAAGGMAPAIRSADLAALPAAPGSGSAAAARGTPQTTASAPPAPPASPPPLGAGEAGAAAPLTFELPLKPRRVWGELVSVTEARTWRWIEVRVFRPGEVPRRGQLPPPVTRHGLPIMDIDGIRLFLSIEETLAWLWRSTDPAPSLSPRVIPAASVPTEQLLAEPGDLLAVRAMAVLVYGYARALTATPWGFSTAMIKPLTGLPVDLHAVVAAAECRDRLVLPS